MFQFEVLTGFFSPEFKSEYVEGLKYTVRSGNDKLAACFTKWEAEGKVRRVVGSVQIKAEVKAVGKVK